MGSVIDSATNFLYDLYISLYLTGPSSFNCLRFLLCQPTWCKGHTADVRLLPPPPYGMLSVLGGGVYIWHRTGSTRSVLPPVIGVFQGWVGAGQRREDLQPDSGPLRSLLRTIEVCLSITCIEGGGSDFLQFDFREAGYGNDFWQSLLPLG